MTFTMTFNDGDFLEQIENIKRDEKSFKTSDFKTKSDGSIEFTADDGTIIRASEYEIKKLN